MKVELTTPIKEIQVNPIDIIRELAHGYDSHQAEFINIFANALKEIEGESMFCGTQTLGISENLSQDGKDFILALAEFIQLKQEQ